MPAEAPPPARCATILPRRRAGGANSGDSDGAAPWPGPVSITLDLLEGMADLTIAAAARRIRVSATSLKKACRRLGVDRWPFRRAAPAPADADERRPAPRDFDEAYVRGLRRKYGARGAPRRAAVATAAVGPAPHSAWSSPPEAAGALSESDSDAAWAAAPGFDGPAFVWPAEGGGDGAGWAAPTVGDSEWPADCGWDMLDAGAFP